MRKYAKIIDNSKKTCIVGMGDDAVYYKSIGMSEMDVEQGYDGNWYVQGYAPQKPNPTKDDVSDMRKEYRRETIDDKTAERSRKMANGSWTPQDEVDYLEFDARITAYIEEHFPYPAES